MRLYYNQVSGSVLDVKEDKRTDCFNFGKDNAFPSLIEALINMSVTSKTCVDRVAKAIYGGAFGDDGDVIVNSKGESLNEVLRIAAREYAKHNNVFLQIGYDGNFDYKSIVVVPVVSVRIGKADDKGYSGKFLVYENWDKSKNSKIKADDFIIVDRFSKNKEIAERQIVKLDGDVTQYDGQIIHIRKDNAFVYSLSDLNPVLDEALLESNSQKFRSKGAKDGFLDTKLLTTQPFKLDKERKAFKKDLKDLQGAENSHSVLVLEAAEQTDDLSKQVKVEDLASPVNDKLFEYSDTRAEKNIAKAWTVPLILISPSDNSIFGNSGALLKEAKIQLWESREEDRNQLEEAFIFIMANFSEPVTGLEIVNPYEDISEEVDEEEAEDINAVAQANLRGSVGGVTALLAIQQSVGNGLTTKDAGIAMIVNIYGFTEEQAEEMLGNPEPIKKEENE